MALVVITILDGPDGPSLSVTADPPMPTTVLQGKPTPAQCAAALMLNALDAQGKADAPRIVTIN